MGSGQSGTARTYAATSITGREGTPGWTRTSNLRFRRPLLYPIELQGRMAESGGAAMPTQAVLLRRDAQTTRSVRLGQTGQQWDSVNTYCWAGSTGRPLNQVILY